MIITVSVLLRIGGSAFLAGRSVGQSLLRYAIRLFRMPGACIVVVNLIEFRENDKYAIEYLEVWIEEEIIHKRHSDDHDWH